MNKLARILVGFALVVLVASSYPLDAGATVGRTYRIIVNASNPVDSLTSEQASSLFLKKEPAWDNGIWVVPVDQHRSSDVREEFTRDVHRRSVSAIRSYWQRSVFSGLATPGPTLKTDEAVVSFVARSAGAIGYVSVEAPLQADVKIVPIVD